jgi:hypothetical protein
VSLSPLWRYKLAIRVTIGHLETFQNARISPEKIAHHDYAH